MAETKPEYSTIHKYDGQESPLDFNFLRSYALSLLQKYSGNKWTDFNFHDPGITILEYLCFSITDLAYRTILFPIEDILTNEAREINSVKNSFFPRNKILTTNPVTITDLRHYIIDQLTLNFKPAVFGKSGTHTESFHIHNLWFKPLYANYSDHYVKSKYEIIVQLDNDFYDQFYDTESNKKNDEGKSIFEKVELAVWNALNECRNISECIENVRILERQSIRFKGELKITNDLQPEETLAAVYNVIVNYLNPHTIFHSESELLESGMTIDRIYDGPFLNNGFITNEIEDKLTGGMIVDLFEIIKSISSLPGIMVEKLEACLGSSKQEPRFSLKEYHYPYVEIDKITEDIKIIYDHHNLAIRNNLFESYYRKYRETSNRKFLTNSRKIETHEISGNFREIGKYYSIQKFFPGIYRIGIDGIESEATEVRKIQAKQLKGYLIFFEQLLANYLKQLANIDEIFAPVDEVSIDSIESYFSQPLYDIPYVSELLKDFTDSPEKSSNWKRFVADSKNSYITALATISETPILKFDRKNRSLDFMLARFNLNLDDYPLYIFREIYGVRNMDLLKEKIIWKSNILRNVDSFTGNRNKADIYYITPKNDLSEDKRNKSYENNINCKDPYSGLCSIIRELLYLKQNDYEPITNALFDSTRPISIEETQGQPKSDAEKVEILGDGKLHFPGQGIDFFNDAIDKKNYKIEKKYVHPSNEETAYYQVEFNCLHNLQSPVVGYFMDYKLAKEAIDSFIKELTEINIKSEGFYLLEHVLLAPPMSSSSFGFSFEFIYDEFNNSFVLKYRELQSFYKRNDTLESINNLFVNSERIFKLLKQAKKNSLNDAEKSEIEIYLNKIHEKFIIFKDNLNTPLDTSIIFGEQDINNYFKYFDTILLLINSINNAYSNCKNKLYPFLTLKVLLKDDRLVNESLFGNRVSIFLPNWPARFQNRSFIHFVIRIFKEYLPSYVNLTLHMLNINEMREFESLYFPWKEKLSEYPLSLERENLSKMLISFIDPVLNR